MHGSHGSESHTDAWMQHDLKERQKMLLLYSIQLASRYGVVGIACGLVQQIVRSEYS